MRGYGADEALVHRRLVPDAMVITGKDRVRSAAEARTRGATAIILDDGFQHRRAARDADVVLMSADRHRNARLLPSGPWREPITGLRRATHVIVTRKRTALLHAREVEAFARRVAPHVQTAIVHLEPEALIRWDGGGRLPVSALAGSTVLAVCAVADPRSFEAQVRDAGARVAMRVFRDHHEFSRGEIDRLAAEAPGATYVVCTLKDAVKLGPNWPPSAPPIWYLSQHVTVEQGAASLQGLARSLAAPRTN
jgi:tetraacyldisaccharide 4'-kinase